MDIFSQLLAEALSRSEVEWLNKPENENLVKSFIAKNDNNSGVYNSIEGINSKLGNFLISRGFFDYSSFMNKNKKFNKESQLYFNIIKNCLYDVSNNSAAIVNGIIDDLTYNAIDIKKVEKNKIVKFSKISNFQEKTLEFLSKLYNTTGGMMSFGKGELALSLAFKNGRMSPHSFKGNNADIDIFEDGTIHNIEVKTDGGRLQGNFNVTPLTYMIVQEVANKCFSKYKDADNKLIRKVLNTYSDKNIIKTAQTYNFSKESIRNFLIPLYNSLYQDGPFTSKEDLDSAFTAFIDDLLARQYENVVNGTTLQARKIGDRMLSSGQAITEILDKFKTNNSISDEEVDSIYKEFIYYKYFIYILSKCNDGDAFEPEEGKSKGGSKNIQYTLIVKMESENIKDMIMLILAVNQNNFMSVIESLSKNLIIRGGDKRLASPRIYLKVSDDSSVDSNLNESFSILNNFCNNIEKEIF